MAVKTEIYPSFKGSLSEALQAKGQRGRAAGRVLSGQERMKIARNVMAPYLETYGERFKPMEKAETHVREPSTVSAKPNISLSVLGGSAHASTPQRIHRAKASLAHMLTGQPIQTFGPTGTDMVTWNVRNTSGFLKGAPTPQQYQRMSGKELLEKMPFHALEPYAQEYWLAMAPIIKDLPPGQAYQAMLGNIDLIDKHSAKQIQSKFGEKARGGTDFWRDVYARRIGTSGEQFGQRQEKTAASAMMGPTKPAPTAEELITGKPLSALGLTYSEYEKSPWFKKVPYTYFY